VPLSFCLCSYNSDSITTVISAIANITSGDTTLVCAAGGGQNKEGRTTIGLTRVTRSLVAVYLPHLSSVSTTNNPTQAAETPGSSEINPPATPDLSGLEVFPLCAVIFDSITKTQFLGLVLDIVISAKEIKKKKTKERNKMRSSLFGAAAAAVLSFVGLTAAADAEEWKTRSVYQVMIDRFARTDGSTDHECEYFRFCGGTWRGLINKLDYIQGE